MSLDINRNEKVHSDIKRHRTFYHRFSNFICEYGHEQKILNKIIKRALQYIINKPNYNFTALSLIRLLSCKYTSKKLTIINA